MNANNVRQETIDSAENAAANGIAELRRRAENLESACRAVLESLEKLATDGEIIWLDPPHVLPGVHESAIERLKSVIEQR